MSRVTISTRLRGGRMYGLSLMLLLLCLLNVPSSVAVAHGYAEICTTGDMEAVRIDPTTGRLIFVHTTVTQTGGGGGNTDNENGGNGTASEGIGNISSSGSGGGDDASISLVIVNGSNSSSGGDGGPTGGGEDLLFQNETYVITGDGESELANITNNNTVQSNNNHRRRRYLRSLKTVAKGDHDLTQNLLPLATLDVQPGWKVTRAHVVDGGVGGSGNGNGWMTDSVPLVHRALGEETSSSTGDEYGEVFYVRPCLCYATLTTIHDTMDNPIDDSSTSSSSSGSTPNEEEFYLCHTGAAYCGLPPPNTNKPVQCYDISTIEIVARDAWPLILLWYFALILLCFCTIHGHFASDYIKIRLFGDGHNQRFMVRMLGEDGRAPPPPPPPPSDDVFLTWQRQRQRFEHNLMLQVQFLWNEEMQQRQIFLQNLGGRRPVIPCRFDLKVKKYTAAGGTTTTTKPTTSAGKDGLDETEETLQVSSITTTAEWMIPEPLDTSELDQRTVHLSHEDVPSSLYVAPLQSYNDDDNNIVNDDNVNVDDNNDDVNVNGKVDDDDKVDNDDIVDDVDDNSLDEPACTICFAPLEEGDRIGDLPCNHQFHVDCLKSWLERKNACPLCNGRLATKTLLPSPPMFDDDPEEAAAMEAGEEVNRVRPQLELGLPLGGGLPLAR